MTTSTSPSQEACAPLVGDGQLPLAALFARCEAQFIAEFDRRLKDSEFCALSLAHSRNVLRHLGSGPLRASKVVEQCGVSKQAISQQIAHLEKNGYLDVEVDPSDARARLLLLTPKGRQALTLVTQLFAEIESEWEERIGRDDLERVRAVLTGLLADTGQTSGAPSSGCDEATQLQVECSTLP